MEEPAAQRPAIDSQRQPSHRGRGLLIAYFTIAMLPPALFGVWVGVTDLLSAIGLLSRLFGGSLLVVGLMLIAGYVAIWRSTWRRELTLLACIAGAFSALALAVIQVIGYDINVRLAFWLGAGLLLTIGAIISIREGAKPIPLKQLGALLSAGTIIGLAQLFYSSAYFSAHEPSVSISANLSKVGSRTTNGNDARALAFNAETRVKNLSSDRIAILGSTYILVGVKREQEPRLLDDSDWLARMRTAFEESSEVSRLAKNEELTVLASGIIYGTGYTLSPNEEDVFATTLYAPSKGFDSMFLKVTIATALADRLNLEDAPIETNVTDDSENPTEIWDEYRIQESSLVNRLTRERRYLHTGWLLKSDTLVLLPDINVYVDAESRRAEELSDYNERLEHLYSIDYSSAISIVSLWH
jgi:hypothetical protein